MTKTCDYTGRLHLMKDGELSSRESGMMMNHLRTCEACQAEWKAITRLSRMMAGIDDVTPRPDFDRAFWAKVDHYETTKFSSRLKQLFAAPGRRVLVPVFATIILTVVIGLSVYRSHPVQSDISLTEQMELLDDFDVVNNLDLLENWDAINRMELKS